VLDAPSNDFLTAFDDEHDCPFGGYQLRAVANASFRLANPSPAWRALPWSKATHHGVERLPRAVTQDARNGSHSQGH